MSEERLVRFELEYADGRIRRLTGEQAQRWYDWLNGAAQLASIHDMAPVGEFQWEELVPPGVTVVEIPGRPVRGVTAKHKTFEPETFEMKCACGWEGTVGGWGASCPRCGVVLV